MGVLSTIWSGIKAAPQIISLLVTVLKAIQTVESAIRQKEIANDMNAAVKKAIATPGDTDDITAVFAKIHNLNNS